MMIYRSIIIIVVIIYLSPTEVTRRPILTYNGSNYIESRKGVPFGGLHKGRPHLGGQIP